MGVLDRPTRLDSVRLLVHFVNKDARGLAHDFLRLDFLPPGTDHEAVAIALASVFRPEERTAVGHQGQEHGVLTHGEAGAAGENERLDFRGALAELSSVMEAFRFRLPPVFALVIRALGALEGTVIKVPKVFYKHRTPKTHSRPC